jgi:hypothetical protein
MALRIRSDMQHRVVYIRLGGRLARGPIPGVRIVEPFQAADKDHVGPHVPVGIADMDGGVRIERHTQLVEHARAGACRRRRAEDPVADVGWRVGGDVPVQGEPAGRWAHRCNARGRRHGHGHLSDE